MITRRKHGIVKPNPRYATVATTTNISPIPSSVHAALRDANWLAAMQDEYAALLSNRTWELGPRPPDSPVVSGKWIFRYKFNADGSLARYKARWVVRGFSQRPGLDYDQMMTLTPARTADPSIATP